MPSCYFKLHAVSNKMQTSPTFCIQSLRLEVLKYIVMLTEAFPRNRDSFFKVAGES